jgi:putative copper export protein
MLTVPLSAARGLHDAGSFVLFGTAWVAAFLVPAQLVSSLRGMVWGGFGLLLLAGFAWFVLQTADMAGARDVADFVSAAPVVATATRFGTLLIGRCAALLLALLLFQFGWRKSAALAAGLAVAAQAWLGHGGAMTGTVGDALLVSSVVHLLSGGAWLGALPALHLALRRLPLDQAAALARRFSPIGMACVLGLVASGTVQTVFLVGTPRQFVNNGYGLVVCAKIFLLLSLLVLAAANRWRFTPPLLAGDKAARRRLLRSVGSEICLGLLALLAAGLLLQLAPPTMAAIPGP